ncbi:serine protease [Paraglaciecola aquimarina]|uniref:Serine protease n=1 Tax=Paraglaciecola aquimarina TaxID=1235557 RepID=A0ABU3SZB7_9ALTE|nr:serine protease [Paraglaciecola aquimarina]MDU0355364.1 serine protease [Paraglaciecola aquimarina]
MRILLFLLCVVCASAYSQQTAQSLFGQYQNALYQIKIIDLESGNKSSIGSGFQVDQKGNIVTNYHVVSEYIYYPEKFRIEYMDQSGHEGQLQLVDLDVINDLALVRKVELSDEESAFPIASSLPEQGSNIYSLGNPHDLGMIVVPGTFNGLKKNSFYQRIHFTGSINPGMSGGPVVNGLGEVMGVNVATAGNQIGFLIPLAKVTDLLSSQHEHPLSNQQLKPRIQQQLMANQQRLFSRLKNQNWKTASLGKASIPSQITEFVSCWGDSNANNKEALFLSVENRCRIDEQIFLHSGLNTGGVELEFEWLDGKSLGQHRFYAFYTDSITGAGAGNKAGKVDVTNYQCQEDKVTNIHGVSSKTILCLRGYKEFDKLYDVLFVSATLDHDNSGLISHFTLAGVAKDSAQTFTKKFMDSIEWQ